MNRLAITSIELNQVTYTAYIALDGDRDFVDFELFEPEGDSLVERIFIGRAEKILSNIQAVFVRISPEIECYLPLEEVEHAFFTRRQSQSRLISQGDEMLVQVTKDAVRKKKPVVSAKLSIAGRYSVLTTANRSLSVSKKLPGEQRNCLGEFLRTLCKENEAQGYGVILRTNSAQASQEELAADVRGLVERYLLFRQKGPSLSAFAELYRNMPGYIRRLQTIRDLDEWSICTDLPEIYERISTELPYLVSKGVLELYQDPQITLAALYNLRGNIERLLARQVWLPSGGNLIIDTAEAMTVIDVNTAKSIKTSGAKSAKEQAVLAVNMEAAREIARQLRLRNLHGIIIVDFINMEQTASERTLVEYLKSELARDPVPCQFIDITKLGLVEMTRKKVRRSLSEIVRADREHFDVSVSSASLYP